MLNELMLAQQIETMRRLHLAWIEFEGQPLIADMPPAPPRGFRHMMAEALVRLGLMLDRTAGQSSLATLQPSGNKEVRHAL